MSRFRGLVVLCQARKNPAIANGCRWLARTCVPIVPFMLPSAACGTSRASGRGLRQAPCARAARRWPGARRWPALRAGSRFPAPRGRGHRAAGAGAACCSCSPRAARSTMAGGATITATCAPALLGGLTATVAGAGPGGRDRALNAGQGLADGAAVELGPVVENELVSLVSACGHHRCRVPCSPGAVRPTMGTGTARAARRAGFLGPSWAARPAVAGARRASCWTRAAGAGRSGHGS